MAASTILSVSGFIATVPRISKTTLRSHHRPRHKSCHHVIGRQLMSQPGHVDSLRDDHLPALLEIVSQDYAALLSVRSSVWPKIMHRQAEKVQPAVALRTTGRYFSDT